MIDSMEGVWLPEQPRCETWRGEPVRYLQPKHDGWRLLVAMQPDASNGLVAFGRKREPHLELSHALDRLPWWKKLEDTMPPLSGVDGELWVPGEPATFLPTALKTRDPRLKLTVFAVHAWAGARVEGMGHAQALAARAGLEFVDTVDVAGGAPDAEKLKRQARRMGLEGWALKESHLSGWYKVKVTRTADVVCVGYREGRGKFIGECGALQGAVWRGEGTARELVEVVACSGMQEWQRAEISAADVGRVFEVEYDCVGASGRLTRPRFIRWRDDKPAQECGDGQLCGVDGVTVTYEGESVRSGTYRGKKWRAVWVAGSRLVGDAKTAVPDLGWRFVEKDGQRLSHEEADHVRRVLVG
jgi:hypothetical protein